MTRSRPEPPPPAERDPRKRPESGPERPESADPGLDASGDAPGVSRGPDLKNVKAGAAEPPAGEHYHLWLGYRETGRKRRERRTMAWAANGGGDFPEALPQRPQRGQPARGRGVRQFTTSRLLRFETAQRAHQHRKQHYPEISDYLVRRCRFTPEDCPSPEPIPIWERRDDR